MFPFHGLGGGGYFARGSVNFDEHYRAYALPFEKAHLESGNKVILPTSALDKLHNSGADYPMTFEISSHADPKVSHCGVLEFVAHEGEVWMPQWMLKNLRISAGDVVKLKFVKLAKGKFVKLQPHSKDFLDINDPKAVLEMALRNYSCLTVGDTFCFDYSDRMFFIDVKEAKPDSAILTIETDCEVDFEAPLDYEEPSPNPGVTDAMQASSSGAIVFGSGTKDHVNGSPAESPGRPEEDGKTDNSKFLAFSGTPRRLDGKPSKSPQASPASLSRDTGNSILQRGNSGNSPQVSSGKQQPSPGKVGSKEGDNSNNKPKFQAFSGKGHRL